MIVKAFADNLSKKMEEKNLSIADLSRLASVPRTSIDGYFCGREPPLSRGLAIAKALGTTVEELCRE